MFLMFFIPTISSTQPKPCKVIRTKEVKQLVTSQSSFIKLKQNMYYLGLLFQSQPGFYPFLPGSVVNHSIWTCIYLASDLHKNLEKEETLGSIRGLLSLLRSRWEGRAILVFKIYHQG
jgi:hypothetical protein